MISEKCIDRGIITNSHDLGVKLASKAQNECIRYAQMLCNFTPNTSLTSFFWKFYGLINQSFMLKG